MSISVEGLDCPVCGSHLFDDDDVVFCPICGAPHHRECYQSVGHCALEELHGTDKQYERPKIEQAQGKNEEQAHTTTKKCPYCGEEINENALFCLKCGRSADGSGAGKYTPSQGFVIDPMGGVAPNEKIEDVSAGDAARYVVVNTPRYIHKFKKLNKQSKVSWNWAAFLFPGGWFCYRKCYKPGIIFLTVSIICSILLFPSQAILNFLPYSADGAMTTQEMMQLVMDNIDKFNGIPLLCLWISNLLNIAQRILAGLFGDYIYRQTALEKIRELKKSDEYPESLSTSGGINLAAFLLSAIAASWIPTILFMMI